MTHSFIAYSEELWEISVKRVEIYCGRCHVIIMDSVVDIQFVKVKVKHVV